MKIELSEYQASLLHSSIEQSMIIMREEKVKVSLISSLAIAAGVNEYFKLKALLTSSWSNDAIKDKP